jgi:hypothetical protein
MRKKDRRAGFVVSGEFILGKKGEGSHLSYAKGRKSWAEPEVTFPDPSRRFFPSLAPSSYPVLLSAQPYLFISFFYMDIFFDLSCS